MKKQLLNMLVILGLILGSASFVAAMDQDDFYEEKIEETDNQNDIELQEIHIHKTVNKVTSDLDDEDDEAVTTSPNVSVPSTPSEKYNIDDILKINEQVYKDTEEYEELSNEDTHIESFLPSVFAFIKRHFFSLGLTGITLFFTVSFLTILLVTLSHLSVHCTLNLPVIEKVIAGLNKVGIKVPEHTVEKVIQLRDKLRDVKWLNFLQKRNQLANQVFSTEFFLCLLFAIGAGVSAFATLVYVIVKTILIGLKLYRERRKMKEGIEDDNNVEIKLWKEIDKIRNYIEADSLLNKVPEYKKEKHIEEDLAKTNRTDI